MAISLSFSSPDRPIIFLKSEFPLMPLWKSSTINRNNSNKRNYRRLSISVAHSSPKIVPAQSLDRHVVKHNKIRFVQKLKMLLLQNQNITFTPHSLQMLPPIYPCQTSSLWSTVTLSFLNSSQCRCLLLHLMQQNHSLNFVYILPQPQQPLQLKNPVLS